MRQALRRSPGGPPGGAPVQPLPYQPLRPSHRVLLAALAGLLVTAAAGACSSTSAAPQRPDPTPTAQAPAPPRQAMDDRSMCVHLLPTLGRATTVVTEYLRQPAAVDKTALAETVDKLTILHDGAPEAMLKDLSTEIDTLISIEEHLAGKRSAITNVEGFRMAGLRLMDSCERYVN
ncbi:MAG TPA: hypothetical protein VFM54_08255 [Micromonosporaceae bacterium]|nr:hypothetical protein [Micromonosporaceae bacterium]